MDQKIENVSFGKLKIFKNIAVLSIGFLFLYTSYNGLTMLQSTMNKIQGIGTDGQAVLYASYGISSLLISSYTIKKLGIKIAQILGMFLYLPYIAANFYPSWITIIPSAILIGIGSTINWVSQCTYFNECSVLYNRIVNKNRVSEFHSSSYTSNIQMSEKQIPSNILPKERTKQDLNKKNGVFGFRTLTSNPLQTKLVSNYIPGNVVENNYQPSEKIKEKSNYEQAIGEQLTTSNRETKLPATLKDVSTGEKDDISCYSIPERDTSKQKNPKSLSSTNALFFSFHGLAYCSSQIWSNLLCFAVLNYGITKNFQKTSNCLCGANFCVTEEACVDESIEEVPDETRYFLTGLCVGSGAIGVLIVWLFLDPLDKREEEVSFSLEEVFVTIRYFKKKEQLYVIPVTILGGKIQAFYTADITKSYIACSWTLSQVGMVTVFYGVSSALSAILSGVLIKYLGRIPVLFLSQILNVANLVFLLLWIPDSHAPYLFYIEGAVFGFIVGVFHTQIKALYGTFFEGDEETAFSSCNMYSSLGWTLPFVYSDFLCTSVKIYILLALSCLGIVGYLLSERSFSLRKKQLEEPSITSHS